ncbi:hypothetical protein WA026_001212 [Henosepilachna vigintioctopunctata]
MGSSSGGKKKYVNYRSRQRAQMSFFIVVIFFAVFGIIVFSEIFLIDERGKGAGVLVRHGSLVYHSRQQEINEYEESLPNDDYISIRLGADLGSFDNSIEAFLLGKNHIPMPVVEYAEPQSSKDSLDNLSLYPNNLPASRGSWQNVNGTRYKFFVFSAFYDRRKMQRSVRIIGATKTRGPDKVFCKLWYKTTDENAANFTSRLVPAKIRVIRENWNLKYSACFVMCPLLQNQTAPNYVSVVSKKNTIPTNLLEVTDNYNETRPTNKFGVCVKPFHFEYNRALQMLEFIELNRILGVEHFTFYNHTMGPQVDCLLRDYIAEGLVTLLPWQLDMVSQKEIRTEGLFAALNDCLYRSMYKYSHLLLIDLDEFIIPRNNDTLPQLIDYLNRRMGARTTGSYSFQNAFFYLQWSDDETVYEANDLISPNLVTLRKTRRRSKLHPHKQRSKYICRPELVVEAGNHFVWEFLPGHGTTNSPPDAAILHHYRVCEFGGDDCVKTASTVDTTAFRYKDRLVEEVRRSWDRNKGRCEFVEPTPPPSRVFSKLMSMLKSGEQR